MTYLLTLSSSSKIVYPNWINQLLLLLDSVLNSLTPILIITKNNIILKNEIKYIFNKQVFLIIQYTSYI